MYRYQRAGYVGNMVRRELKWTKKDNLLWKYTDFFKMTSESSDRRIFMWYYTYSYCAFDIYIHDFLTFDFFSANSFWLKAEMTFFCVVVFLHESTMRMISLFFIQLWKTERFVFKISKILKTIWSNKNSDTNNDKSISFHLSFWTLRCFLKRIKLFYFRMSRISASRWHCMNGN